MDKFINPTKPAEIEIEKDEPVVVRRGQNTDQTFYGMSVFIKHGGDGYL